MLFVNIFKHLNIFLLPGYISVWHLCFLLVKTILDTGFCCLNYNLHVHAFLPDFEFTVRE